MSPIREKFIKIIDSLPYDLDKEVLNKNTKEILQDGLCRHAPLP